MESIAVLYVTALLLAALLSAAVALYAWKNRRVNGAYPLAILLAGAALWSFGYSMEIWAAPDSVKLLWAKFQYFGILCIPAAWLVFTLQFGGWGSLLSKKRILWLLAIPAVTLGLVWTNELHRLVWPQYSIENLAGIRMMHLEHGPGFYTNSIYSHLLIIAGGIAVLQTFLRSQNAYRRQAGFILAAAFFPWIANLLYVIDPPFMMGMDLTPFSFAITGGISAWSLFRSQIMSLLPIARHILFEKMSDGVMVLDAKERIQDLNQPAAQIVGMPASMLIGKNVTQLGTMWDETLQRATSSTSRQRGETLKVIIDGAQREYLPKIMPINQDGAQPVGFMVFWSDVTDLSRMEAALNWSEQSYLQFIENSPSPIFSIDSQGLIQSWNHACEQIFEYGREAIGGSFHFMVETAALCKQLDDYLTEVFQNKATFSDIEAAFCSQSGIQRLMLLRLYPVIAPNGEVVRCVVACSDITARRQAEAALLRQLLETKVLNTVAQACVDIQDEDVLIARITEIIGKTMYPKNFGLLLYDERENALCFHHSYIGIPDENKQTKIPLTKGITGKAASSGQPVRSGNVGSHPEYVRLYQKTQSELCAPLRIGDRLIGVINVESEEPQAFSESDERLVLTLASQIATAIDRLRADAAEHRRLREIGLLSKVISSTAAAKDINVALEQVCIDVAQYLNAPQAGFALIDRHKAEARVVAEYQEPGFPSALGFSIPIRGNPSMEYILEHRSLLAVDDAQNDPRLEPVHDIMRYRGIASILIVPVLVAGDVAGTLGIDYYERHDFKLEELRLIQDVASQLGQALERLELYAAVQTRAVQLERLARVSASISRSLTYDQVIMNICQGAMSLSEVNRSTLYVRSPDGEVLCAWYAGLSEAYIQKVVSTARQMPGGRLFESDEPVLIADIEHLPEESPVKHLARQEGFRAYGLWPLVYERSVVAAVGCYFETPITWTETHIEIMTTYARQCAIALQNSHLFDETRQRAFQMEALNKIVIAAAAAPSLPELLSRALELAAAALSAPYGVVWTDEHVSVRGLPEDFIRRAGTSLPSQHPVMSSTIVIEDWQELPPQDSSYLLRDLHIESRLRASIYVPLTTQGNRIGGLAILMDSPRTWHKEEILLLESIGSQLGNAAERLGLLEKIRAQADQVQRILDAVPEGVLLLDHRLQVVLANPAAQAYLKTLSGEYEPGMTLKALGNLEIRAILDDANSWCEIEVQSPDKLVFDAFAQPLRTAEPQAGWVLVLRDLTEERNTQVRLQTQDRLATVGQLAAGIAHDFNNIMAAISVYSDLLLMEPRLSQPARERLEIIQRQVLRASSLIRQILDFSRRSVLEHSHMDLLPFIKELDKLLARVIPENIRIELKYQPGSYLVNADPTRLQQVFMNLALNSRDAMPDGGVLGFELGHYFQELDAPASLPELTHGSWVVIRVWDTGNGIPPESMEHIFEPFFTTKPVGKGTGLGLAQVYGIIKQHGGCIDVKSQIGAGTQFTLYLPELSPAPCANLVSSATQDESLGNGETVLIVEDDNAARHALQCLLQTYNYKVLSAENGLRALHILHDQPQGIALVISDMVMPEIGGMELYRRVSENGGPQIKFLFITGHPMDEASQALLEAGKVRWLQKPFSAAELTSLIRYQLLERD